MAERERNLYHLVDSFKFYDGNMSQTLDIHEFEELVKDLLIIRDKRIPNEETIKMITCYVAQFFTPNERSEIDLSAFIHGVQQTPSPFDHHFEPNETVLYAKPGVSAEEVTVLKRHMDDFPNIYYTIRISADVPEKQTPEYYLTKDLSIGGRSLPVKGFNLSPLLMNANYRTTVTNARREARLAATPAREPPASPSPFTSTTAPPTPPPPTANASRIAYDQFSMNIRTFQSTINNINIEAIENMIARLQSDISTLNGLEDQLLVISDAVHNNDALNEADRRNLLEIKTTFLGDLRQKKGAIDALIANLSTE